MAELVGQCPEGFVAAGAYETLASEVAVVEHRGPVLLGAVVAGIRDHRGDGRTAGAASPRCSLPRRDEVDPAAIGKRAADKAVASRSPRDFDPGRYTVILEPSAVSTLVGFLAWIGFGGRSLFEGRSCFSGRQDEQVAAPIVTIYDDALSDGTLGLPFDFEGVPRSRVDLIDGRGLPRRRLRPANGEAGGDADHGSRPTAAEPRGAVPPQPVHGPGRERSR